MKITKIFVVGVALLALNLNAADTKTVSPKVEISEAGNKILRQIDENLLPPETVFYRKLINIEPDGSKKEFVLFTAKKGRDKILSTFLQPKSEVGRNTLRVGDNMWLYIPSIGRPIRITSLQSITGGIFNNSDILRLDFSAEYNCVKINTKDAMLILKAKTGSVAYDKVIIQYDKKRKIPTKIECYTSSGMLVKTLHYKNIKDFGNNIVRPAVIETDSPMYKGYKSVMIFAKIRSRKLPDELFTINSMTKITDLR